ncbi:MAG TPA: M23 family metallopeptidase [Solirubrobacteraceae bacterium]|nr:M23 family metallopeptidase [Solirubrobacteraceae bacterium]
MAQASDSPGGVAAPTASATAQPAGAGQVGGTGASAGASTDAAGAGGAVAPSTKGTGGSEYGVVAPRPRVVHKPAVRKPVVHKPARTPRHAHAAPKPKVAPTKPKPAPTKPKPAPVAAGAPSPAQTVGEGAVFPVIGPHSFGDAANRFDAGRAGHLHQGQDVLASEGLEVRAPLTGTIITTAYQAGGAGWYVAEHTGDGLDFLFAHCQASSLAVSTGEAVSTGQALCRVGQTGDATGPHLHFEVWVGGWQAPGGYPIDPLPYLEAWDQAAVG